MGCADSRYLRSNLKKLMSLQESAEENNRILYEDLIKCSEANREMLKVLRNMKSFIEDTTMQKKGMYFFR